MRYYGPSRGVLHEYEGKQCSPECARTLQRALDALPMPWNKAVQDKLRLYKEMARNVLDGNTATVDPLLKIYGKSSSGKSLSNFLNGFQPEDRDTVRQVIQWCSNQMLFNAKRIESPPSLPLFMLEETTKRVELTHPDELVSPAIYTVNGEGESQKREIFIASKKIRDAWDFAMHIAMNPQSNDCNVLLSGETGTGKELFAQGMHFRSPRARHPFVVVNCGAVPEGLFAGELFGHEKGSFTSGDRQRKGKFEEADRGTLFLDEIDKLNTHQQATLLRVLEGKKFTRVGGNEIVEPDVHVICAGSGSLHHKIKKGEFREDLFFRLSVPIDLIPFRERADRELLLRYLVEKECIKIEPEIYPLIIDCYSFPGNLRELLSFIRNAAIHASMESGQNSIVEERHLLLSRKALRNPEEFETNLASMSKGHCPRLIA